mgnify:CR=1 FL=1
MIRILMFWALVLPLPAAASEERVARFEAFARTVGPLCATAPSTRCFAEAFAGVDRDGDGGLTVAELERMRADLGAWLPARGEVLIPAERLWLGLWVRLVDVVGLDALHAAYDTDDDGSLSPNELAADIALDERPMPVVLRDADAVDWDQMQARVGALAGALVPR